MQTYRAEENAELLFEFPDGVKRSELDVQGVKLPIKMQLVDLVIERDQDTLLIEIKDPSHSRSPFKERKAYWKRLENNSVLSEELTPKARDSYLYMHLMERDAKPFKYIVLLGLDAYAPDLQKGLLANFKDRLLANIREESFEAWRRKHIADCVVLSVDSWNQRFPDWQVRRETPTANEGVTL